MILLQKSQCQHKKKPRVLRGVPSILLRMNIETISPAPSVAVLGPVQGFSLAHVPGGQGSVSPQELEPAGNRVGVRISSAASPFLHCLFEE